MDFRKIISGTNSKTCQKWSFWSLLAAAEHVCSRAAFVHPFERVSNAVFGWNLPLLGCLKPPNRSQGLRRLLSASGPFLGRPDEQGKPEGEAGQDAMSLDR